MTNLDTTKYFADRAAADFADALQRGDLHRAQLLLAKGIQPDAAGKAGFRPIHFAVGAPTADALQWLLGNGADPNARVATGNTPLLFAVRFTDTAFTRALLAAGADPNARTEDDKPVIHEAILSGQPQNVEALARAGADIDVRWGGGTPVYRAAAALEWPMVAALLRLGADPTYTDPAGRSAATILCEQLAEAGRISPAALLELKGAYTVFVQHSIRPPCELPQ